jgi:4,5-dihydroxyphthalate decarboxylase
MDGDAVSFALDRYDRHFPFFDGTAPLPGGVDFDVLQVGQSSPGRDGTGRHERMYPGLEFDICEFGLSPYLMLAARDAALPFTAIPCFPRRLFSQSQMWVRKNAGIEEPQDLAGKRIALRSFHTTLSVLARGDLKSYYGTAWEDIVWRPTKGDMVAFEAKPGVSIEPIPPGADLGALADAGEIDGCFMPHPPPPMVDPARMRRLFADAHGEEAAFFRATGAYPIMHLVVIRNEVLDAHPGLARALVDSFRAAQRIAESYYDDPNWSRLAWGRQNFEHERASFGADIWPEGFAANKANLARFIGYSFDQGLIPKAPAAEELFAEETLDT